MFHFDVEKAKQEISELEKDMASPGFWDDIEKAQKVSSRVNFLKNRIATYKDLNTKAEDLEVMIELSEEEEDSSILREIEEGLQQLDKQYQDTKLETLLDGEYDEKNAILSIHAGAGGTEAQDWAQMLMRMYTRWAEKRGYDQETLDILPGDEAGLKSATILIKGAYSYGYLKSEKGVHRLVRISPFDSSGRRHTSFAAIEVMPEIDDDNDVDIDPNDLRIDTYRASGAGGQHVNKTDSAIRITHIPTGVVVQCQNERSQHKNKATALKMLKSRLAELKEMQNLERIEEIKGEHKRIEWGSQIRSYVFHPYSMVKDHRTNAETGNIGAVMDGDIDLFINEYLKDKNK